MSTTPIKDLIEEDTGPSVDSSLLEERIAARRLRIARRLETLKKYVVKRSHCV